MAIHVSKYVLLNVFKYYKNNSPENSPNTTVQENNNSINVNMCCSNRLCLNSPFTCKLHMINRVHTYSEIRCIALCVLYILGFSVPSIILADLLRDKSLLAPE